MATKVTEPDTVVEKTKFYQVEEVAEIIGLDEATVRMFLRHGHLRGRRIGKRWYVTEPDLQAFIDNEAVAQAEADRLAAINAARVEEVYRQEREDAERQAAFDEARKAAKAREEGE